MSNLADRITDGSVIVMLDFGWWPAFNFADVFIILGGSGPGPLWHKAAERSSASRISLMTPT
ncbi:MAG: signal peptidase II [Actinomycetota bacterium]|nr:signal peptidase II [Actinomycetota bacterium]